MHSLDGSRYLTCKFFDISVPNFLNIEIITRTGLNYVTLGMKSVVAEWTVVGYWIPNKVKFVGLVKQVTIKSIFRVWALYFRNVATEFCLERSPQINEI
jgi:hypothetical protein